MDVWLESVVQIQHASGFVGTIGGHLYLHAALRGLEQSGEAGLVLVREHARNARVFELCFGELGVARSIVAGDGNEAIVIGHGSVGAWEWRAESAPDSYFSSHFSASASGSGVSPVVVRLRATYLPIRSNSRFTAVPSSHASDTFVCS